MDIIELEDVDIGDAGNVDSGSDIEQFVETKLQSQQTTDFDL